MKEISTVVLDANILYPASLRSLLMYLTVAGLFRACWTEQIHQEWIRNVLRDRPDVSAVDLAETRRLMDHHAQGSLITQYEVLIPTLNLPDPNDRHVLAAAIHRQADLIVTFNTEDFPDNELDCYGIEAQHPDYFLWSLFQLYPRVVISSLKRQREKLVAPPVTAEDLLSIFASLHLSLFVQALSPHINLI